MRALVLCLLVWCGACNGPGPAFWGSDAAVVDRGGTRFLIRQVGALAEVTRITPAPLPDYAQTAHLAAQALHARTGCRVAWISGDPAMMTAGLACRGQPPPPQPESRGMVYCDAIGARSIADARSLFCQAAS